MPDYAAHSLVPPSLSANVDFYRYGFHGISCCHSMVRAAELLAKDKARINCIILHLGGAPARPRCGGGVSVDTSMGFSPAEGLMMATRSGDVAPMILLTLLREGWTADRLDRLLNRESDLLGRCGIGGMREALQQVANGNEQARLAVEICCYRTRKTIGAFCAVLGDLGALIFTSGIGEYVPSILQLVMEGLGQLGFMIDAAANSQRSEQDRDIGSLTGKSGIMVIHAEEELEIAAQILDCL